MAALTASAETASTHWPVVLWLAGGALFWSVTSPLRELMARLYGALGYSIYKWAGIAQACLHRYRCYVQSTAVQELTPRSRLWKSFEVVLATPLVILKIRRENKECLGRLLYKCIDAVHAYWCVYLPETIVFTWESAVKYWCGLGLEGKRIFSRGLVVVKVVWSLVSLAIFTFVYSVLFAYETAETLCMGSIGLFTFLGLGNGLYLRAGDATENEVTLIAGMVVSGHVVLFDGVVLVVALLGRVWRWCEADKATPWQRATSGYEHWLREMEEREQAERLSRAFWEVDGAAPRQPPATVRTLSQLRTAQRALHADIRAAELLETRRGRRVSVGEDVPSRIGGHRLGSGSSVEWRSEPRGAGTTAGPSSGASEYRGQ